jgi:endonuclease/exonuclease/phosphatase family metal-dependent hydrolase
MKKKRIRTLEIIVLFFHVLAALGLLLANFSGQTAPSESMLITFTGLAYFYLLAVNILFLFWWILCRRYWFVLATLTIILLGWNSLIATIHFGGDKGSASKVDLADFRLLTYNVHEFKKYGEANNTSTKDQIIEVIKKQSPDVICFQEFYTRPKGEYNMIKAIKKQIGLPYFYFVRFGGNDFETVGHAIFSRYPIENSGEIIFSNDIANKSIYADIKVNKRPIRIYNVHFQSISFDKEDYDYIERLKSNMETEYKPTRRILGMLKRAFLKREVQTDLMKDELNRSPYPYIIAGDFNDTPSSYTVTQISSGIKNAFCEKGSGLGKTYNGKFPNFQIDYIMTSTDFNIHNYQVINARLSDHFPVRSDVSLSPSNSKKD